MRKNNAKLARIEAEILKRESTELSQNFRGFIDAAWDVIAPGNPLLPGYHIDAIAEHLQACSKRQILKLVICQPPRTGKPVSKEGFVWHQTKGRTPLREISVGDAVLTHKGRFRSVLAVHEQGLLDCLRIKTFSGKEMVLAPDHVVLTSDGWKEAGQLTTEDVLAEVHPQERCGTLGISVEEARLLGYMIGDGCCSSGQPRFTNETPETLDDFERCAQAVGFDTRRRIKGGTNTYDVMLLTRGERESALTKKGALGPVRRWLASHNLDRKDSYQKTVPAAVLSSPPEIIAEFLGAYWACDGTVMKTDGRKNACCIEASTVSKQLAYDVRHLLNRLGIRCRVRIKKIKFECKKQPGGVYTTYLMIVNDIDNGAKFAQSIPVVNDFKSNRLKTYKRTGFNHVLNSDPITEIEDAGSFDCACLTIEEDASFVYQDLAVHNSSLASVLYPAWLWTHTPEERILSGSYSETLAMGDAVLSRRVIESEWYQARWPVKFAEDVNTKKVYENTRLGRRQITSTGGPTTGLGGNTLLADDLLNALDAESATIRNSTLTWFREAFSTRGNAGKPVVRIMVMQRLHQNDPAGYVIEEGGWDQLVLPMEYETGGKRYFTSIGWTDPRTQPGELLWPARFGSEEGKKELAELKKTLGSTATAGQLQQRPVPRGGGQFKAHWMCFHYNPEEGIPEPVLVPRPDGTYFECPQKALPKLNVDSYSHSWDCAFKGEPGSDYVVGQVWARGQGDDSGNLYLLDQDRGQYDMPATVSAIRRLAHLHPSNGGILVEDKANGSGAVATLKSEITGLIPVPNGDGKFSRAAGAAPAFEAGNVWIPHPMQNHWVSGYIDELTMFPRGNNDDQVDATTQALFRLREQVVVDVDLKDAAQYRGVSPWAC